MACASCGFNQWSALDINHINGGGSEDYKTLNASKRQCKYLRDADFTRYNVLCHNCNWIEHAITQGFDPGNDMAITLSERPEKVSYNQPLTFEGQCMTVSQWAKIRNINESTIRNRLHRKLPIERVLSQQDLRRSTLTHQDEHLHINE
jgi:hypothetical protein